MKNIHWLVLLREEKLFCHLCGLLIYEKEHLTADHWPTPKCKGGVETYPAHAWCNLAQGKSGGLVSIRLEGLLNLWTSRRKTYPEQAEDSLIVLKWKEAAAVARAQYIK